MAMSPAVRSLAARSLSRGLTIALAVVALDQLSKWWIVAEVMNPPRVIEVTSFFDLVMAWNTGVSFSLFTGSGPWVLIALSAAIVAVLTVWLARAGDCFLRLALGLVIGGAIGNVIDRLRFGAVADFLHFHIGPYSWPAFNVADSAITVGAVLLVWDALFRRRECPKNEQVREQ